MSDNTTPSTSKKVKSANPGGRPKKPIWRFFEQGEEIDKGHYVAKCVACKDAQSVLGPMVRPVFRYLKTGPKRPRSSSVSWSSQKITNIKNAFRWISRQPSVVERRIYYHSTRLDEAILMSCVRSFHDHWMTKYSTKRQQSSIYITILRRLPFRWIVRHTMILESWICYHSTRLD